MLFSKASIAAAFVAGCAFTAAVPTGGDGDCSGVKAGLSVCSTVKTPSVCYDGPEICGLEKHLKGVAITKDGGDTITAVGVFSLHTDTRVESVFVENGVCTVVDVESVTQVSVSSFVPGVITASVYESIEDCEAKKDATSVGHLYKPKKSFSVGAVFLDVSVSLSVSGLDVKSETEVEISGEKTKVDQELSVVSSD